jgi:heme/copper-type cytochrome/quinol oxidase subunit 3
VGDPAGAAAAPAAAMAAVVDAEIRPPRARGGLERPDRGRPPGPPPERPDGNGDGDPRPGPDRRAAANARLGMWMLLGGETMFFGGLVIAFLHLRLGAATWPPPGQPRLPVGLTAVNTVVLLASSGMLVRALGALRAGRRGAFVRALASTWALGILFLLIQGVEWTRLVQFGLRVSSGIYGATFYTLIGVHGLHVLGAVLWMGGALWLARRGGYTAERHVSLACCAMYWHYVVALWPVLYVLIYLA